MKTKNKKVKGVEYGWAIVNIERNDIAENYTNFDIFKYRSDAVLGLLNSWRVMIDHKIVKVKIERWK